MENKINNELKHSFRVGYKKASDAYDEMLRIEHIVWGVLTTNNFISEIVNDQLNDINIEALKFDIDELINTISSKDNTTKDPMLKFEDGLINLINSIDKDENVSKIGVEDYFLKIYDTDLEVIEILNGYGITKTFIEQKIKNKKIVNKADYQDDNNHEEGWSANGKKEKVENDSNKTPILDNFCRDITDLAAKGTLDPVIGREDEIERVAQILSRRKKNNPIIIGEPGVGKTAIVEGLAIRIALNECPPPLQGKRLVALDLTGMVAGTKYRGQFEERIKGLIEEVKNNPNIIMFIDEIHTLIGAGNSSGSLDAANIFKPALARGELQCIGATTLEEYHKSVEKDGALDRRFQRVVVEQPTAQQTLEIIKRLRSRYEDYHKVTYTDEAIEEIVRLADRYISTRFFPDKAIDIMDEAGARCRVSIKIPQSIKDLEEELQSVREEKFAVVQSQRFELAANLRDNEKSLERQLAIARDKFKEDMNNRRIVVDQSLITEVVSMMTGIPVNKVSQNELVKLVHIDKLIMDSVIGQDEAIKCVSSAIRRNRTGIRRQGKPIGSFLFVGPSGVGKTELAKVLADKVFGSRDALIKVDMSEYSEKFNASKLIGSPPGYVGYEEGGQLTEKVKNKPYSVVLFDEIEKAHPDIFNVLLQLLDEGQLTDGLGRRISFKNTIVIMTSNVGVREFDQFGAGIGFTPNKDSNRKNILDKAINARFRPEFLNRIDEIVHFNALNKDNLMGIINLQLNELKTRLKEDLDYDVVVDDSVKDLILKEGYNEKFGAREIQRTIQRYVEDAISEKVLEIGLPKSISLLVKYDHEANDTVVEINNLTENEIAR